jgi:hypothetical protein
MRVRLRVALMPLMLCLTAARDVQAVAALSPRRLDCQSAARQVRTGSPKSGMAEAYNALLFCAAATAAPALAAAWTRVAEDTSDFRWREASSVRFADRRILDAALAVGTSSSRSVQERVSALSTMMMLLSNGGRSLSMTLWDQPQRGQPDIVADIDVMPGEQPITAADRSAVLQALRAMASTDSDPRARLVAQRLAELLQ